MAKFVIYDTEHFETTYALIRILDKEEIQLAIFTTSKMEFVLKEMLGDSSSRYLWNTCKKSNLWFAVKLYHYCSIQKVSHLFLNTVSYHHIYFGVLCGLLRNTKSILTIHNANSFFNPKFQFRSRSIIQFLGKKSLKLTANAYATLLESTKQYIREKYKPRQPIYVLPGGVNETVLTNKTQKESAIVLLVCGSIDEFRRDYNRVFELAYELEQRRTTCEIVLLGSATGQYGKDIIMRSLNWVGSFVSLKVYTSHFVSTSEYEMQLKQCHFIFHPLNRIIHVPDRQPEEYGISSSSGSFFDAIRFAKPILLPSEIQLPIEIAAQCVCYCSIQELADFLNTLSETKMEQLQSKAQKNSLNFTVGAVRKRLWATMDLKSCMDVYPEN